MRVCEKIQYSSFHCTDINPAGYIVPDVDINPSTVSIMLISEAAPKNSDDYYYSPGKPVFASTKCQTFQDAGADVKSIQDIIDMGVYFTTAVKCRKTAYGIKAGTIKECSMLLEQELDLFPNVDVYLLMGDVAIKAINYIAKRAGQGRVIPAGSTYKLRGEQYFYQGKRAFPSYLQAGPSFNIEKSKRRMIAEDIASALRMIK